MLKVITLATPELGDRSYLAHDGALAVAIDPQRDIDRVLELARSAGVRIAAVAETHLHNDYVSGGPALSDATRSPYLVAAAEQLERPSRAIADQERMQVGDMTLQALATPGHTSHHLAWLLTQDADPGALFSGGSLLYGAVGRTDLVSPQLTEGLAREQHRSARRLGGLPPSLSLYPTHGFGSFCSAGGGGSEGGTLGQELQGNPALLEGEADFVSEILANYTVYPTYYREMAPLNRRGLAAPDLGLPPEMDADHLADRIAARDWVVDLRPRTEFARGHVRGTVNFPACEQLATYIGWVIPWGLPLTLMAGGREAVLRARRDLCRIGIDRLDGWWPGPLAEVEARIGRASYRVSDFAGLARAKSAGEVAVLDVRRPDEWRRGHIRGAVNIHLPELPGRLGEIPENSIWVHCGSGYRAAAAASILDREGREVVLVDDEVSRLEESGLALVPAAA